MKTTLFTYILHLADNALILAQRNSEWTGHGPVLEQDIAITNISLDLLGQARNFYEYASTIYNNMNKEEQAKIDYLIPALWKTYNRNLNEDDLAFIRDESQYLNLLLTELPKGDWAFTVLRQFFFSCYQHITFHSLEKNIDQQLSSIAQKSLKEVTYHLKWSSEWVIRLGNGTSESNLRINNALNDLWSYTGEFFSTSDFETKATEIGLINDFSLQKEEWLFQVNHIFSEATLSVPKEKWTHNGGKKGQHTEHMGYLLAEMQYMQRAYPNMIW